MAGSRGVSTVPLRRRLLLLVVAGILPVATMSGLGLWALERQQSTQIERVGLELARALALAVDAELRGTISVLESLATAATLDQGDAGGFLVRARRVKDSHRNWVAVVLANPSGTRIADTRLATDRPSPALADRASFETVLRTRGPAIGNLAPGVDGAPVFRQRVPVMRRGELRYVLTAVVRPDAMLEVIRRQRAPEDWVISIFDANGRRVARSRAHEANLGGLAAPSLRALMAGGADEGFGLTYALE